MTKALASMTAMMNTATRRMSQLFPGYFQGTSHNHYKDFRWPEEVTFADFHKMYSRNGLGKGIVAKTSRKVWESAPMLQERVGDHEQTTLETQVAERFADLRLWQRLAAADRRSLVGAYAGVILRIADSQGFDQPVTAVSSGLQGLVELIPAWEGQLNVAEWEDDQGSENYGHPKMYEFDEAAVGKDGARRKFNVHPDRVVIWSEDGTIHGEPFLKGGYNDLLSLEKISGAGGEGFWKNAKSAPVIEVDKEAKLAEMARSMGVDESELVEAMNEQVEDWQGGFDQLLMLQGMQAKALNVGRAGREHQKFLSELQARIKAASLSDRILFPGEVPATELPQLMRGLSLVVQLPRYEGYGMVPLEGMSCGVPFVGSHTGYYEEFSAQGKTGTVVPLKDADAAAKAALAILSNPSRHDQMGKDARDMARHGFSAESEAAGIETVYQNLWTRT